MCYKSVNNDVIVEPEEILSKNIFEGLSYQTFEDRTQNAKVFNESAMLIRGAMVAVFI